MSPSSRAIFSPLKLGFSYSTHLVKKKRGQWKGTHWQTSMYDLCCSSSGHCIKFTRPCCCIVNIVFCITLLHELLWNVSKQCFRHGEQNIPLFLAPVSLWDLSFHTVAAVLVTKSRLLEERRGEDYIFNYLKWDYVTFERRNNASCLLQMKSWINR